MTTPLPVHALMGPDGVHPCCGNRMPDGHGTTQTTNPAEVTCPGRVTVLLDDQDREMPTSDYPPESGSLDDLAPADLIAEIERLRIIEIASIGAHALLADAEEQVAEQQTELDDLRGLLVDVLRPLLGPSARAALGPDLYDRATRKAGIR